MSAYLIILTISVQCFSLSYGADAKVELTLSRSVARPGESLTAVCNVSNMDTLMNVVIWTRRLAEDGQEVEIATNFYPNNAYLESRRYKGDVDGSLQKSHNIILYKFVITDLQVADSGELSCKIPSTTERIQSGKPFTVQAPVRSITWSSRMQNVSQIEEYRSGQNVTYKEGEMREFTCLVNGSYPKPTVNVYLGDQDVTSNYIRQETMEFGPGPRVLRDVYYKIQLSQNVSVGFELDSKQLKCVSRQQTENLVDNKSTLLNVELSESPMDVYTFNKPHFLCNTVQYAELNQGYYSINCTVRAKPAVHDLNFWPGIEQNSVLEKGERRNEFQADVQHMNDSLDTVMILTIDRVLNRHYRKYTFEANNRVGKTKIEIELKQDFSKIVKSGAMHTGSSGSVTASVTLLSALILIPLFLATRQRRETDR